MQRFDTFDNIENFIKYFYTEDRCRKYIEKIIWDGEPVCPFCSCTGNTHRFKNNHFWFKCNDCRNKFKITHKTIMEGTHLSLRTWFVAIYFVSTHSKGFSSTQVARYLKVTQATSWYLIHRIRKALQLEKVILSGIVEIDEVYIGGKKKGKRGRGSENKIPVLGMVERGTGRVVIRPVKDTKAETLIPLILDSVSAGTRIITDENPSYNKLKETYQHDTINHSLGKYVDGEIYTNTIEGVWSLFKRALFGIYHSVSEKHLHRYCSEFAYRYSMNKLHEEEKFNLALKNIMSGRLKLKDLTSGPRYSKRVGEKTFTASNEEWKK